MGKSVGKTSRKALLTKAKILMIFWFLTTIAVLSLAGCVSYQTFSQAAQDINKVHLVGVYVVKGETQITNPPEGDRINSIDVWSEGVPLNAEGELTDIRPYEYDIDLEDQVQRLLENLDTQIRNDLERGISSKSETDGLSGVENLRAYLNAFTPPTGDAATFPYPADHPAAYSQRQSLWTGNVMLSWHNYLNNERVASVLNSYPDHAFLTILLVVNASGYPDRRRESLIYNFGDYAAEYTVDVEDIYARKVSIGGALMADMRYAAFPEWNLIRPVGFYPGVQGGAFGGASYPFGAVRPAKTSITSVGIDPATGGQLLRILFDPGDFDAKVNHEVVGDRAMESLDELIAVLNQDLREQLALVGAQ